MEYQFLDSSIEKNNIILPLSEKINPFLLKNNYSEILTALDFFDSEEKFLYIHGFMGTGKRQFVNYLCEFLNREVIKLEYYCKEATVCDDILLTFIDEIGKNSISKAVNLNTKVTTLGVKFHQLISSIKKPFLIILHSFDDIQEENQTLLSDMLKGIIREENVKIIISTRALKQDLISDTEEDRKIYLRPFTQEVFKEFLISNHVESSPKIIEDFYKYTRGYYYYTALSVKIIQAMNIELAEFISKLKQSGMSFDSFLGVTYINLIPSAIRNFFWFLRTIRHGLTLNALAVFEIYDEFSVNYLKNNLMIFQSGETIYVQDYFLQKIDISIPSKTEIKLHKYIVSIYEKQLKEPLESREINISRQAMRAEIEYHNNRIAELEQGESATAEIVRQTSENMSAEDTKNENKEVESEIPVQDKIKQALELASNRKYTDGIEILKKLLESDSLNSAVMVEVQTDLAKLYKEIENYRMAAYYYELVENFYKQNKEYINLNYLYYDMTDLYFKMYKNDRAIDTIKKVIYSVDTPQSLMVSACTLLGNIYSDINNPEEAYSYYKKALDSLDENVTEETLSELYFKFALANDDKGETGQALNYYNKCVEISNNPYSALAYANMASCYFEDGDYKRAEEYYLKAYEIEKKNNNYDGIYYNASGLAKIYALTNSDKTEDFLKEAKRSAEFINEEFYILESCIALGDYYYNNPNKFKESLKEYFRARKIARDSGQQYDISKIEQRIEDMRLRMSQEDFRGVESRYGK